jgi:pentatricopeptide repeat protein
VTVITLPSHLKSQQDLSSNVEELELLQRERHTRREQKKRKLNGDQQDQPVHHQETQQFNNQKKPIKTILSARIGDLTHRDLIGLCNSIRFVSEENSLWSLRLLYRILSEVNQWEDAQHYKPKKTFVKKIHVFSVLTALSKGMQSRKSQKWRYANSVHSRKNKQRQQQLSSKEVDMLKSVVFLLKELCREKRSLYCDTDCYQRDVLSFATMIAASSMMEESAVDAALMFIDEMDNEIDKWDPRIIGAVLNALSYWGRAEEAHLLLSRSMGFNIPTDSSHKSIESVKRNAKSLSAQDASPCYDALLRSYSKRALILRSKLVTSSNKAEILASSAEALTRARYILLNHMPTAKIPITNHTCNALLSGYSAMGRGSESEQLLLEIEALHASPLYSDRQLQSSSRPSVLDAACYNSVLHGYSQETNGVRSAKRLFGAMKDQTPLQVSIRDFTIGIDLEGFSSIKILPPVPDVISYVSILNCYSNNRMGEEAYDLVQQIELPTQTCYLTTIRALEKSYDPTSPDKVLSLVGQIEVNKNGSLHKKRKGSTAIFNRQLFNAAMQCMITHGQGLKAEDVLNKYFNSDPSLKLNNIQPYILALKAYENTKSVNSRIEAAERAETLFRKMQSLENVPRLDVETYNILLNCYARAGMASEAECFLKEFDKIGIIPNAESYNLVIKAISLSDDKDAIGRAWAVLYNLGYPRKRFKDADTFDIPITTFNSMLKLFARRGMATEAEALLHSIDESIVDGKCKGGPDINSYEAILEALGKTDDADAVERAEALVTRVEVMSELGGGAQHQPSLKMYNLLLNCYGNAGKVGSAERLLTRLHDQSLKPDAISYGATMKALKNSGKPREIAVARSRELSQCLERNNGVGNEIIFAHRLSILAKFGLASQAENLLQEMSQKCKMGDLKQGPGVIHYTAVLNAWSKSDDKMAVVRAETLFKKMKSDPHIDLDLAAYHGLLLNYAVRGISQKARRVLQVILDSGIKPNRNTFTIVIDSYSRATSTTNAGKKAEELLDQMRQLHAAGNTDVEPDNVCYASVIRCKQASKQASISDLTEFDKLQLMRELQIEKWPFQ